MSPSQRWRPSGSGPRLTPCFRSLTAHLLEAAVENISSEAARRRVEVMLRRTLELLPSHAKAALGAFWGSDSVPEHFLEPGMAPPPLVQVGTPEEETMPPDALGATDGFSFTFLLPFVATAPDISLRTVTRPAPWTRDCVTRRAAD